MAIRRTGRVPPLTALILAAALAVDRMAAGELRISIEPPQAPGTYRVTGRLQFHPGAVHLPEEVAIFTLPDRTPVPLAVLEVEHWPEQAGIMQMTVAFIARSADIETKAYRVEWGSVSNTPSPAIDRSLPELRMEVAEDSGAEESDVVLPIGTLVVKVRERPEIWYYWYLVPILGILALLIYRKRPYYRESRSGNDATS